MLWFAVTLLTGYVLGAASWPMLVVFVQRRRRMSRRRMKTYSYYAD